MTDRLRLVVLGMMGAYPYGGQSWLYLNWLSGFSRLGHDVYYVEDHDLWPFDPTKDAVVDDWTYGVAHVESCCARIGLGAKWAVRSARQGETWGMSEPDLKDLYASCDMLLNIVGITEVDDAQLASIAPFRVYVETDPVTDQLRMALGHERVRNHFANHHAIASYAENYGAADCGVPTDDLNYIPTRQPVDVSLWPQHFDPSAESFTTIGNYRHHNNVKDIVYEGEIYRWSKHHEWQKFLSLPRRRPQQRFEMATQIRNPRDRERLEENGWSIVPPLPMSLDVFGAYQDYFRSSRAEFTVAKDQNVRLRSGWFSERDVCYLACGKPVIAQDTGFSKFIPSGEGLFAFTTIEQVEAAVDEINSDYKKQCDAARSIAEDYFEATSVAARLLDAVGRPR